MNAKEVCDELLKRLSKDPVESLSCESISGLIEECASDVDDEAWERHEDRGSEIELVERVLRELQRRLRKRARGEGEG